MSVLWDRTTILIMVSALVMALLCILPESQGMLPFAIIAHGAYIANTMFHELGHTLFYWLFGQPAIPAILTLFGADQAGGVSLPFSHNWVVQIISFAGLVYACYWAKKEVPYLFIPAIGFSLFIVLTLATGYQQLVIAYMGHGGSIAMGGFFLFRAWIYLDARNQYERWLNAFFGFFLILANFYYCYGLAFDSLARADYIEHVAFGVTHNDYWLMAVAMPSWSIRGIALFTMGYCAATIIGSAVCAVFLNDSFVETEVAARFKV